MNIGTGAAGQAGTGVSLILRIAAWHALSVANQLTKRPADTAPVRRVVKWNVPAVIGAMIGTPGWSGLAAALGAERRSHVVEALLLRATSIVVDDEEHVDA